MNNNMNGNMSWWSGGGYMGGTSVWWIAGAALLVALTGVVVWAVMKAKRAG